MNSSSDNRRRVLWRSLAVLVTLALLGAFGVFAAYTATTTNPGNSISAGSVAIGDNDGSNVAMYTAGADGPLTPGGAITPKCIKVTYTGSLASSVKLYVSSGITNGASFNLKIERGTQTTGSYPACGNFSATSTAFDAALNTFGTTYAGGVDGKASGAAWNQNDEVAYRFTLTAIDDATANAHTSVHNTGDHTFTWEARSN
jgi:hypothetical protein